MKIVEHIKEFIKKVVATKYSIDFAVVFLSVYPAQIMNKRAAKEEHVPIRYGCDIEQQRYILNIVITDIELYVVIYLSREDHQFRQAGCAFMLRFQCK